MEPLDPATMLVPAEAPGKSPVHNKGGRAFSNYTSIALGRMWNVSADPKGGPPMRDCGLGLVDDAKERAAKEREDEGGDD
jgi:hypothetical protein